MKKLLSILCMILLTVSACGTLENSLNSKESSGGGEVELESEGVKESDEDKDEAKNGNEPKDDEKDQSIIGTWKAEIYYSGDNYNGPPTVEITFNEDGTFVIYEYFRLINATPDDGEICDFRKPVGYEVVSDTLIVFNLEYINGECDYEYDISRPTQIVKWEGDTMELHNDVFDTTVVMTKLPDEEDGGEKDKDKDKTKDKDDDDKDGDDGTNIFVPTSSGTFSNETKYDVNTEPQGIDCADYNNDGYIDLAVTNRASNKLSILLGVGDGTFGAKNDTTQGADPFGVISADFDGDGNLDLVITNASDNDISVRLGVGDGTFDANTDYAVGASSRYIYATTDFDKDGNLDLALTNAGSDDISIFFGNGDGSFDESIEYSVGDGPIGLVAADFDNDDDIDLAVANDHVTTVSVLLNDGDGTLATAVDYVSGTNPWGITAGDFNGDYIIDLAVANYNGGNISILLGVGDGTFGNANTYNTTSNPNMIVSADFNGDGAIDLAVACRENGGREDTGQISILFGVGDGTFSTKVDYASTGDPLNLCTADFNNDGILDIAAVNYQGDDVSVFMGQE